jgi:hypothetical protein
MAGRGDVPATVTLIVCDNQPKGRFAMLTVIWLFLRPFLPYILGVLALLGAVWAVHDHGDTQGYERRGEEVREAEEKARAHNAELAANLDAAIRTLASRSGNITTGNERQLTNEKARATAVIADLRERLRNAGAGACVPDTDAAARCLDVAAAGVDAAVNANNAARANAAQVDGLQLWAGQALKASASPIPDKTKAQLTAAEARFAAREKALADRVKAMDK